MPARIAINYNVVVHGIVAGEALYDFNFRGADYQATARRQITGLARTFLGNSQAFSYSSRGRIEDGQVHPVAYRHEDDRRHRVVQVAVNGDEVITAATPRMGMGHPPATPEQKIGTIDQVSMFAQMLMGQDAPCSRTFHVFLDGRSRFDLILRPNGTQRVNLQSYRGVAQRCAVQFNPIAGFSDPQAPARLDFLFATINGPTVPIVVEMPTDSVGIVRLEARSYRTAAAS
ncbi:MAG: DUF3108 domain-containing protein, partial [Proteobacteria bacterium]|nr:DUF3108 domain-containing protein [Pseudomonadota bacterium]